MGIPSGGVDFNADPNQSAANEPQVSRRLCLTRHNALFINTLFPHQFTDIVPPLGNCNVKNMKSNEIMVPLSIAAAVT